MREATQEIERNMRQMADLVEQVAEKERKRIAADLHDDLGAKLLTIVHTSESTASARPRARHWRRCACRCAASPGDRCAWRTRWATGAPRPWPASARPASRAKWARLDEALQMLSRAPTCRRRASREATSNIIKYSGASRCSVSCVIADGDFQLVIQDNGDGISQDVDARLDCGHGLASMKNRAKQHRGNAWSRADRGMGIRYASRFHWTCATGTS
ncbi:MAG: hypothetical protein U1F25_01775 [Rubrivivax sp.]